MAERNIDVFAARLGDPNLGMPSTEGSVAASASSREINRLMRIADPRAKLNVATELRDNIEVLCNGPTYAAFLAKLVPVCKKLLEGPPEFMSTAFEHVRLPCALIAREVKLTGFVIQRLRNCVLEIFHRLPMSHADALRQYAVEIVDMLMRLVREENEDNAVLCMKTIMDLERHQPETTASRVQPFLDLILEMFETMEQVVKDKFDTPPQGGASGVTPGNTQTFMSPRPGSPASSATSDLVNDPKTTRPLPKGMQSFKVFAECPIIVVSLFQAHRHVVPSNVKKFVPAIKTVLMLQAKPQERAHEEARKRGDIFTGVSREIKDRVAFGDFITAQVKMMSFLAYLLRTFSQQLQDFLLSLPNIVVRLLRDCPSEKSATRKELLVAIRHTINFNFRRIFLEKIDDLLDERTLIGEGLTVYETMRPLAYSLLADLIHHVRDQLTRKQIQRTVDVFSRNLHDNFPGTSFQTMSAKLLLNMADSIASLDDKKEARHFLIMILNAIGDKFAAMNRQYPNAVKLSKLYEQQQSIDAVPENHLYDPSSPPDWDDIDIFTATPVKTSNPKDRGANPVDDNKFLFKNLLSGLKAMFYQLKVCNPKPPAMDSGNTPANWSEVSFGYSAEEVEVIIKLFREGAYVFRYYTMDQPSLEISHSSPIDLLANQYMAQSSKEEKELLETFATAIHSIDPATFHEVFQSEIPRLYDMMFEHSALLHIPQFFLASEATSPSFAGMLLQFLMERIKEVGTSDVRKSSILLRMFKLSFMAVTLFSQQNEQVLLPHVKTIVTQSIQLSTTAEEPMNYFYLLRSLFRSIGGGRFEQLYKEILPLLEMLLEVLNNLLKAAQKPQERDLYVELCLTVPARLSNLLPHLSYLMRPLVIALRAGSDLIGQGLRTLELCVDNLTAEYLDPIMAPVIDDLMTALWDHLRPNPYPVFHSHTTMRILGKLGGRNRKFLKGPSDIDFRTYADDKCSFNIKMIGTRERELERAFPASIGIDLAIAKLNETPKTPAAKQSDSFYKQQAFRMISAQIKLHIGSGTLPGDFASLVRLQATDLLENEYSNGSDILQISDRETSISKKAAQEETLKQLLKACMVSTTIPELENDATLLLKDICGHFTIVEIGRALAHAKHIKKDFDVASGEGPLCIDSRVLAEAIAQILASENSSVAEAAEKAVLFVYEAAAAIFGSTRKAEKLPFFTHLAKVFCHQCYEEEWFLKAGGGLGIQLLISTIDLGDSWIMDRHIDFVRALMYIVKDMPQDLPAATRVQAVKNLDHVLRRCYSKASKEDLKNEKSRLTYLCLLLVFDLSHMNKHVRFATQRAFSTIAEVTGAEVHEILSPVKDRILSPIYNRPLRALPFPTQIGYVEAVSYCMSQHRNLVAFTEPLNRLLLETLALADADDETLATKVREFSQAETLVDLRISCIKLLSQAIGFSEFGGQQASQTRTKVISVFFKLLYWHSPRVIDASNAALKGLLNQNNKLPKELLQSGLRPVLMNLQDPKKLTVRTLDGLARLLMLLTNYFKVEIGEKLLGHIATIADSSVLQKASFTLVEQIEQMKIVVAIINVFHLLPPTAAAYMEQIVNKVLDLEESLRRTNRSPLREPLVKYLNRYPKEAWAFFSPRLSQARYSRFLAQFLTYPRSGPLRDAIINDVESLVKALENPSSPGEKDATSINTIRLVHAICGHSSQWLANHSNLREALMAAGKDLHQKRFTDKLTPELRLGAEQAGEHSMGIFVAYLRHANQDFDFLFQVIDAVTSDEIGTQPSLLAFVYTDIVSSKSVDYWRSIVMRCFDIWGSPNISQKTKAWAFRNLVNPIFAMDVMRTRPQSSVASQAPRFIDKSIVEAVHNKIWKPQIDHMSEESGLPGLDHSRLEMVQMASLFLKYHHPLVSEMRKDLIKFAWSYIRLEDTIIKNAAYVLISYFIAHFETPLKLVNQIYVSLLKAHQNEGRALVIEALDLVAPYLPKRMSGPGDSKYPMWAKLAKRILSEESTNLQQLIGIFQFMVRYPPLFYEAREYFIPQIIPSLAKIAQLPTPSNEHKRLVLNLVEMIWRWEDHRANGTNFAPLQSTDSPSTKKRQLENTSTTLGSPASNQKPSSSVEKPEYQVPSHLRMMLIKYLAQFIAIMPERYPVPAMKLRELQSSGSTAALPPNDMCRKALGLFYDLLTPDLWADVELDLFPRITEQYLASEKAEKPNEKQTTEMINTLQILRVVLNVRPDEWILGQLPQLQRLLEKPLRSENPEVQDCLHSKDETLDGNRNIRSLIRRVLDALPKETRDEDDMDIDEPPKTEFIKFFSALGNETLAGGNIVSSINIFCTLVDARPAELDDCIQPIMRAFSSKLMKDQVTQPALAGQMHTQQGLRPGELPPGALDPREMELSTQLCLKTIHILASRITTLGEQRRPFLQVLATLVERSQNIRLCEKILDLVEVWVFNSNDAWPTQKEKTAVLHKMLLFEGRPDPTLLHKFLDLVIRIYEDAQITRSELTVRLEHAFLIGTRAQDVVMRNRYMEIFDRSLTRTCTARLIYVLCSQNWDALSDTFWLSQANQLVFGAISMDETIQMHPDDFKVMSPSQVYELPANQARKHDLMLEDSFEDFMANHKRFYTGLAEVKVRDILEPLCQLQHTDPNVASEIWVALFPLCWSLLARDDRNDLEKGLVALLTKEYHSRQVDRRPNVIQSMLEGIVRARPNFKMPPHVMKFMARTYDAWYIAAMSLEEYAVEPTIDTPSVRESNLDALISIYSGLQEDDFFYGTWRRRCKFVETNAALSYEQIGMWDTALQLYEAAQVKARIGALPFSQGEYMLWEDHWVSCASKLQQWEILSEYAKHENFNDLVLDSTWRNLEVWQSPENMDQLASIIKSVSDAPTPRRTFFAAFMSLLKYHEKSENEPDFRRTCDESTQLCIRKWHQLPRGITNAHIPLLQGFQQLVELHDAFVICTSLSQTNQTNLDAKSSELKLLLGTWRDRLPNVWDDINAWQDLVTWRQHIFQLINKTYLGLLPNNQNNASGSSFAYRGYHETAWIINRFAHVARKHQLPDVCINQLGKIYTLPNIEIQEAFLKLREQAKCHYQNRSELNSGLDVINNTNLNYFGQQQKAEFFTLKGMFLAKLERKEEANDAFGTALFYDIRLPKAWAEWGFYNDTMFKEEPQNLDRASNAVSCYLEAAGLYKNPKSRKLLSRILWLLSIDTGENKISTAFADFKGEHPTWYWITFIPQLLTSLSHREAQLTQKILIQIAKRYPQSLFFQLRTSREDILVIKKQEEVKQEKINKAKQQSPNAKQGPSSQASPDNRPGSSSRPGTANGESAQNGASNSADKVAKTESNGDAPTTTDQAAKPEVPKKPWEYLEEVQSTMKTTFPLLALSMESMVDQISKYFKCPPDEDAYRLIVALLNDGLAYIGRTPSAYAHDFKLPPSTEGNIRKFAETILPPHIRGSFEEDFVSKKPTMYEYIQKLRKWRDKFEAKLDRRAAYQPLEQLSHHLSEFKFNRFDEVEVPGQYLQHRDKNSDFVKIERFLPNVDLVRTVGFSHRRLKLRGHDGSTHPFAVQHPAARHSRREERVLQLFRIYNGILAKRKESRRRNLHFHLPLVIPLAPSIRIVQDDASYISLQGVYEDHCRRNGANKDDPILFTMDKMRAMTELRAQDPSVNHPLRLEVFTAIQERFVTSTMALEYFTATHTSFDAFFLFRKSFAHSLAALTFLTYTMHITGRFPQKMTISRASGSVWGNELIPSMHPSRPIFNNPESVPFRFTPNLQSLLGPLATEGLFAPSLMTLARCLTEPEFELEHHLSIFVRDEMIFWSTQQHRPPPMEGALRDCVGHNSDVIVKKTKGLAMPPEGNLPSNQSAVDLIGKAVGIPGLSGMEPLWMHYL